MSKIIKIIILSVLVIVLSIAMIVLIEDKEKDYLNIFDYNSELILEEEYNSDDIKSFDISSDLSDVTIKKTDSDIISVKVYGDKRDEVTTNVKDNNLYINNDNSTNICLFFCMMDSKIEIMVPKEEYDNLKIKIVSGDIDVEDIIFNNITANSKSGDIKLNKAKKADIDLVSGDITFNEIENAKLVTISGNIIGNSVSDLNAKTISGDVKISTISNLCKIVTTSGDIEVLSLNLVNDSEMKTISGDINISKSGDIYFNISTISGDIYVESNNRFAQQELKISTTSGDVRILK